MRKAIYAGSFDPPTNGHLWMIREAAPLFDELIVAIGINPEKRYASSLEQRLGILRACVSDLPNVRVSSFSIRLLADYARAEGARYILRGIRSESDYEYERGMRYINEDLNPELTTVFLIPPRSMVEVSSSMVKGLIGSAGWERAVRKYVPLPAYRAILEHALSYRFAQLWTALGGGQDQPLFQEIAAKYSEPHRHYHSLAHVAACLSELDQLDLEPAARQTIELAIWFHDVIYDIPGDRNEQRSAEYFRRVAEVAKLQAPIADVVAMILATERHAVPPRSEDEALRLFLDIDLAILGTQPERFDEYDAAIRKEYASVPDALYYPARHRILGQFLERPTLYFTAAFRERYEAQARQNLERLLKASP